MSKALDRLIERERKRQPKRMAVLERAAHRNIWSHLDDAALRLSFDIENGNQTDRTINKDNALLSGKLYAQALNVWREFADPETIDTKKLSIIPDAIARRLRQEATASAKLIGKSTKRRVTKIIADGKRYGLSLAGIAGTIQKKLGGDAAKKRARRIAGTETVRVANDAATTGARGAGMKFKIWITAADEKVRECHQAAHGKKVKIGLTFNVCGDLLRWPGDRTFGPAIGNIINCRCHCVYTRR